MKRHVLDTVSFAFGVVFLVFVAAWLVARLVHIAPPSGGWILATAMIVFGGLGVVLTLLPRPAQPPTGVVVAPRPPYDVTGAPRPEGGQR